jgi:archaetidylinositol phosphate synthase
MRMGWGQLVGIAAGSGYDGGNGAEMGPVSKVLGMDEAKVVYRVHQSWLATSERRLMLAVAGRLPGWVTPDHLTVFGLVGAFGCGLGFVASRWWTPALLVAVLGLVVSWLGDSLDGNLARLRKTERPQYGFFVDHNVDIMAQVLIFFGLGLSPYMRLDTACLCLLSYWLASLYTFIRAVSIGVFQISYFGIGPTEIRIALASYTLAAFGIGNWKLDFGLGPLAPIDVFSVPLFAGVFGLYLSMVWAESRRLAAQEGAARN